MSLDVAGEQDVFSGRCDKLRSQGKAGPVEYFLVTLDIDPRDTSRSVSDVIGSFAFEGEPKLGPALVFRGDVTAETVEKFHENTRESRNDFPQFSQPAFESRGERIADVEYTELAWGFVDETWDRRQFGMWLASRSIVSDRGSLAEVIVLAFARSLEHMREMTIARIAEAGLETRLGPDIENTYIVRPGLDMPPIFYVAGPAVVSGA